MWYQFWDMHSGGSQKIEGGPQIYIEADSEEEAVSIFENRFGRDPYNVTCNCCGSDYSISEAKDLVQATGYHRHCANDSSGLYVENPSKYYQSVTPLEEFLKTVIVIAKEKDDLSIRASLLELD